MGCCPGGSPPLVVPQVRKYRTMTELIVDAIEFVKNPYKGKKLKVKVASAVASDAVAP